MNYNSNVTSKNNVYILVVLAMAVSGILSMLIVLMDADRPECYRFLWVLPLVFTFECTIIYIYRKLLFLRVSITLITGYYWIRMVATPAIMAGGAYKVVVENTSWQQYMNEAIVLICYESAIILIILVMLRKMLECDNNNILKKHEDSIKLTYPVQFKFVFGMACAFFFGMFLRWPILIRNQFFLIFGTPAGWRVLDLEQRSLGSGGSGPLGVLVTLVGHLIFVMQILFPAVVLTKILNKKGKWTDGQIVLASFIVIGIVFVVVTDSLSNSVYAAVALFFTLMSYANKRQLRIEVVALVVVTCLGAVGLWVKQLGVNVDADMGRLSQTVTAYFAGPQNVAAAIQATKDNGGPDVTRMLYDIPRYIPYVGTICKHFMDLSVTPSCDHLFHYALFGVTEGQVWNQVVPAIGAGYLLGGFFLAPLNPAISVFLSFWFERKARTATEPVLKNISFVGSALAASGVSSSLGHVLGFLWYVAVAAIIAFPIYTIWRRRCDDVNQFQANGS